MKHNNINEDLIEGLETKEQHTPQTWIKFAVYLIVACAAAAALIFIRDSKSSVYMFCAIIAIVGALLAVCTAIFAHRCTLYNGEKINGYTLFFETSTSNLQKAINEKDKNAFDKYKNSSENGLKLEVAYTESGSLARYRMYRYIPFEFQPDSEVITIDKDQLEFIRHA